MFMGPVAYFVEAPLGEQAATPSPAAIANAAMRGRVTLAFTLMAVDSL
jgi:hypothetical protein